MRVSMLALVLLAALPATALARIERVAPEVDDPAWLAARGLTLETWIEVGDDPDGPMQKSWCSGNCWHAKVFAAIRGCTDAPGDRCVWAWTKGIVRQAGGQIVEFHQRHDRGQNQSWKDGPLRSEAWQRYAPCCDGRPRSRVFTHYFTDFQLGSGQTMPPSCWSVTLNLNQLWTRRVSRKVKWDHYPCS